MAHLGPLWSSTNGGGESECLATRRFGSANAIVPTMPFKHKEQTVGDVARPMSKPL